VIYESPNGTKIYLKILTSSVYLSPLKPATTSDLERPPTPKRKQENLPMKALLRSSVLALTVFAGYVACTADLKGGLNSINIPRPPSSPCAFGNTLCQK
jgi:hypothetical protein